MKAGILALCDGQFTNLESYHETQEQDGTTFNRSLQIRDEDSLDNAGQIYYGEAAIEEIEETTSVSIDEDSGRISVVESPTRNSRYTEFLIAPDQFAVVASSFGTFAFDLLREAIPTVSIVEVELSLNSFAEDYYRADGVNPWKVGFYGNLGMAEKGVVYGDDVFSDDEIGEALERSQLNQLGLEYEYRGEKMKMTATESGYLEIYQPSNYSTADYGDYIVDEILKYASPK